MIPISNSGTGKTHLAIAAGVCACEGNVTVLFRNAAGLVNELHESKQDGRFCHIIRQMKKGDL
ncbi:MAG: ATP-binding protein [Methanomicrobiales archaeon]|nr:ATP-binding protein [Methanomicrobiales archaeon]